MFSKKHVFSNAAPKIHFYYQKCSNNPVREYLNSSVSLRSPIHMLFQTILMDNSVCITTFHKPSVHHTLKNWNILQFFCTRPDQKLEGKGFTLRTRKTTIWKEFLIKKYNNLKWNPTEKCLWNNSSAFIIDASMDW